MQPAVGSGRPNVAFLVHSLGLGGAERLAAQMALALRDDFRISFVCLDTPGIWAREVRERNVAVECLWRQPGTDLRLAYKLARFARAKKIHLFHAHQYTPWFYGGLARLLGRGPKLIFEEHGRHFPEVRSRRRELFNRLVLQPVTDQIVAVSEDVKRRLGKFEGLKTQSIDVIYNGAFPIDALLPSDRSRLRKELGFGDDDFVVGTIGRFDPVKNARLLLLAVSRALETHPGMKALLVGDGPSFEETRSLVNQLGLQESVVMPGYRADAARLSGTLDLFVLSSLSEGCSVALLESMAAGVPAAVTEVGGNPELVADGETGWVVPSGDDEALAESFSAAIRDARETARRGLAAKRRFEERFSLSRMIDRYRKLYSRVLVM